MNSKPLWRVSVVTTPEAEDPVVALMESLFGQPPSTYTKAAARETVVTVYISTAPRATLRAQVDAGLRELRSLGLDVGPGELLCAKVPREDWKESWKKHFHPIEIGRRLIVKPSWSKRRPGKGQAVVILDPGLSFGTGQHPTTSFCLEEIVAARSDATRQSFLDIGTGSGILSIAAVKLGYSPVRAFDFDPVAVRVARANARRNRVDNHLRIVRSDLTKQALESKSRYDVISANLIDDLLIAERQKILTRLKPGGKLILAGILTRQFPAVARAFEKEGLRLVSSRIEGEWRSGTFTWRCSQPHAG
jgi:ribosomal protein L11 methyltransferase